MNDISNRINEYIKVNGIKQVDIANKAGLSVGFVSKIINGKKPVSNTFLKALSEMTGKSVHYFMFGEDEYKGLASLNYLIDKFISDGTIKEDGNFDDKTLDVLVALMKKEISDKLKNKIKEAQH
ncbi:helix-turn-helix transcriptional regulator [Clostridium botulinum]|nr:helix-turn-helix transcriptional regulator [Clostridium botulinum]NFO38910.1 helix-turn-helix transcriptional regulator [Clostridium botulinum]NFO46563.1 helix-turn-helix transcriptional regulator [Clostridium botulinum]NFP02278.1 helix-turn-helix transcriptional regulator [Clostridium botulinum]